MRSVGAFFTVLIVAAAACGPADAGLFGRKAKAPVAYDLDAIDEVLAVPAYDAVAIDNLVQVALAGPPSWRATGFTPTTPPRGSRGKVLKIAPILAEGSTADWIDAYGRNADLMAESYAEWRPGGFTLAQGSALEFTPHAGFGVSRGGRRAEAGGALRLDLLGFAPKDGRALGSRSRLGLFVAASGQSVAWNFNDDEGPWRGLGFTRERTSGTIASVQAGVAWRQGPVSASLGYARRKVRIKGDLAEWAESLDLDLFPKSDDAVALTFTFLPN